MLSPSPPCKFLEEAKLPLQHWNFPPLEDFLRRGHALGLAMGHPSLLRAPGRGQN